MKEKIVYLCVLLSKQKRFALFKILAKLFSLCDSMVLYILLGEWSMFEWFRLELNLIAGPSAHVLGWIGAPNSFPDGRCLARAGVSFGCIELAKQVEGRMSTSSAANGLEWIKVMPTNGERGLDICIICRFAARRSQFNILAISNTCKFLRSHNKSN